jgi:hypothetical protein
LSSKSFELSPAPSRTLVDLSFWLAHAGLVFGILLVPGKDSSAALAPLSLVLFAVGAVALFVYFFAIGSFAARLGRSGVVWGGASFILSPIGAWITYGLSFGLAPKETPASKAGA